MDIGEESDLDRQIEVRSQSAIAKWSPSHMLSWNVKLFASDSPFVIDFSRTSWNLITNWFLRLWKSIIYAESVFLAMRCDAIQTICTSEILDAWFDQLLVVAMEKCIFRTRRMLGIRWRFGDLVQYRLFIRLILSILRNISSVNFIFLAREKLKMTSGRRRLALRLRNPWLLVSEIFPTCEI